MDDDVNVPPVPLVSVVVTTYNRLEMLGETLKSVATQTMGDFEVIVVDDGSEVDPTPLVASHGPRFRCLRRANGGQPSARNAGIAACRGRWVAFVDDDDLWLPEKLSRQMRAVIESGSGWCCTDGEAFNHTTGATLWRFSARAAPCRGLVSAPLALGNFIASPSVLVERQWLARTGGFDPDRKVRLGEDWLMWLKLAALTPLAYVDEICFRYRIHSGAMTRNPPLRELARSHAAVLERAARFAPGTYAPIIRRGLLRDRLLLSRAAASDARIVTARAIARAVARHGCRAEAALHWAAYTIAGLRAPGVLDLARRVIRRRT